MKCYIADMQGVGIYETPDITFYLYPQKIVVCTHMQCFRIVYERYQNKTSLDELKIAILDNKVKSLNDIAEYSKVYMKWENCKLPC